MRPFHYDRSLHGWSRALLVGFVLAFGLNTIAHAAHRHDPASLGSVLHSTVCDHCVSFGSLATAPSHRVPTLAAPIDCFEVATEFSTPPSSSVRSPAQPRAPPHS